jgi:hypothetical protein
VLAGISRLVLVYQSPFRKFGFPGCLRRERVFLAREPKGRRDHRDEPNSTLPQQRPEILTAFFGGFTVVL